jgi:hypothetical protein
MTLRDIDATVRENSLHVLGSDALNARYITALNMLKEHAEASCAGYRRWKPVGVKVTAKERPEPL